MQRRQLMFLGAGFFLAAIALNISSGKDTPPTTKKDNAVAPAGVNPAATEISKSKPAKDATTKQDGKTVTPSTHDRELSVKRSADEDAIRLTGETYVKAYGTGDAKALAAHFAEDAEYIDEHGDTYQGREAIEGALKALFAEGSNAQLVIDIETIRFVSSGVAIEDGTTTLTVSEGADPISSRYTAVHVKANGKWLAASVREHAPKLHRQHRAQLKQLAWLQGNWVDESGESLVVFTCEAVADGNFLVRDFETHIGGMADISGTQRIGWDPLTGKLRAWIFESDGGYSEGFWHHDGNCWSLKSTGVTSDGQPVSSTCNYVYVNEHTMTWQSVDRELAGVTLPDSEQITIVRRAPEPENIVEISLPTSK